jgi:site-specific DNA recombinase
MSNGTRRAIGYVRVSTAGQAAEGVSLEAQRARIEAAAVAGGYELVAIHADEGLSGKRADNRPGLVAALDAACRQKAVLVVYSLSRMSRSVTDTLAIVARLDKAGAGFVSLTEAIDTTTAAGRMMLTMLSAFAAFERELAAERTTAALHHKRSKGERTGDVPFGWRDEAGTLVAIPEEQAILGRIKDCRAAGLSYRAIAEALTADGVATKKGRGAWNHNTIAGILKRAEAIAA